MVIWFKGFFKPRHPWNRDVVLGSLGAKKLKTGTLQKRLALLALLALFWLFNKVGSFFGSYVFFFNKSHYFGLRPLPIWPLPKFFWKKTKQKKVLSRIYCLTNPVSFSKIRGVRFFGSLVLFFLNILALLFLDFWLFEIFFSGIPANNKPSVTDRLNDRLSRLLLDIPKGQSWKNY